MIKSNQSERSTQTQRNNEPRGNFQRGVLAYKKGYTHSTIFFWKNFVSLGMKKLMLFVFLIVGCEELTVEDLLSDFSTENIPVTTLSALNSTFESSSVSISWAGNEYATSFSYRLETLSYTDIVETYTSWSVWDSVNSVTFVNLDDGNYSFHIKSRYTIENEEVSQSVNFIVDAIAGPALRMYPLYQRVSQGENFNMYIYIEDVVELAVLELHLSSPSNVSVSTMTPGTILSSAPIFYDTINSTDGTIELIATAENFTTYTGSGVLAKLTLSAVSTGLDTLHIKDTSILKNSETDPIDIVKRMYGLIEVVE